MSEDATPNRPLAAERGVLVLADADVDRALGRATAALAAGSVALAVLALLFRLLASAGGAASWVPQVVVLGLAQVATLVVAARCSLLLLALRRAVDTRRAGEGAAVAHVAARWLRGLLVVLPVLCGGVAVVLAATLRPLPTALLSCAVAAAIVAQVVLLAVVQREALRRAGVTRLH
ncbi:MAG: hypothetical protein ACLGIA_11915 [Actinomycetes bacterium]